MCRGEKGSEGRRKLGKGRKLTGDRKRWRRKKVE